MTTPVPVLSKPRDPAWILDVTQPGPNGQRFDGAMTPWRGQATLPAGIVAMYDSVSVASDPSGAMAYAGYYNGTYANMTELRGRFPNAALVSVTPDGAAGAMYIDIEPGDAVPADAPGFIKAGGLGFYCSASSIAACVSACTAAGIARSTYRIWSAHWIGQHICGPNSCGYPQCDGTQYLSTAGWDESAVTSPAFFTQPVPVPPPPPAPVTIPAWQTTLLAKLPVLRTGAIDARGAVPWVQQAQRLIQLTGTACTPDGIYGPKTMSAVEAVQSAFRLPVTGAVDPATWTALVTGGTGTVALPVVKEDSTAADDVRVIQALCTVAGQPLTTDGSFGPKTLAAVKAVQSAYLPYDQVDGIVGPVTWSLLVTHAHP